MSRVVLLSLLWVSTTCAKNLGNYGNLFTIIEKDIRLVWQERLKTLKDTGELERLEKVVKKRVAAHVIHPKPLALHPSEKSRTFLLDPTVTLTADITGIKGEVIASKGTRLNPLQHLHYAKTLIFFNADDPHQQQWVKHHYQDYAFVKFILTGGNLKKAYQDFGRVYFDIQGTLSHKFHLQQVPAVVSQEGFYWRIREVGASDV